ncbi:hypothetical protein BDZ89DRAFT_1146986 [Hymenopellis radicata]|nr:hypothetical protein BDZ89DRAFT_1146986 [Hymenopellis radicata]
MSNAAWYRNRGSVVTTHYNDLDPACMIAIALADGCSTFLVRTALDAEKSPAAMLVEPPFHLNGSEYDPPRWRQMEHACGENPARVYSGTRIDTVWDFRTAYNTARILKEKQDVYREKALAGQWTGLGEFPDDLAWEALVDVLRARVKVHNQYEAVDIDGMLTQTALGSTPASAIFAIIGRYKRESYRHSEYAPRILANAGIDVVMKTDHPLVNARYLLHEAQAHYYGLPAHIALSSVITTPARIMGLAHRIGSLVKGHDADVVIWDSQPLALGAAPKRVYIDGIPQLEIPHLIPKPLFSQKVPLTPNFDAEAKEAVKYDGTQPLNPKATISGAVVFENVKSVYVQRAGKVVEAYFARNGLGNGVVHVENGKMSCYGSQYVCLETKAFSGATRIDLEGGSIAPGLVSVGTDIGLSDKQVPAIVGEETVIRAVDGLKFQSRDMLLAYRSGVTSAVVSPQVSLETHGFFSGLATAFSTGAKPKLDIQRFHPSRVYTRSLQRAFYRGYIAVFCAFCDLLHGPGVINADVQKALVRSTYRNSETSYFFAKGGRVEHVLAAITVEAEKNFLQDMKFLELPQCNRDRKFELAKAKLGLDAATFWGPYGRATSPEFNDEDEGDEMKDFDMEASDRGLRELNEFLAGLPSLDEVK